MITEEQLNEAAMQDVFYQTHQSLGQATPFRRGFLAGAQWMQEQTKGEGMRWVKGDYEALLEKIKSGAKVICCIDYDFVGDDIPCRDICRAVLRPGSINFQARGMCYLTLFEDQFEKFVKHCEWLNVEWLDESPSSPNTEAIDFEALCAQNLATALEQIIAQPRLPGETNDNYAFNRNWYIATKAMAEYNKTT